MQVTDHRKISIHDVETSLVFYIHNKINLGFKLTRLSTLLLLLRSVTFCRCCHVIIVMQVKFPLRLRLRMKVKRCRPTAVTTVATTYLWHFPYFLTLKCSPLVWCLAGVTTFLSVHSIWEVLDQSVADLEIMKGEAEGIYQPRPTLSQMNIMNYTSLYGKKRLTE